MQTERTISEIAMREGYRVERINRDHYRLVNENLHAVMYLFDDVPLETIALHFEEGATASPVPMR